MAELLAEYAIHPRYGILTPFLAAAIVKTMQGNSLTAILTASGMVEPMLPALGLDSAMGRTLAAAAVGAGSMAICHVNDPFFWIAAAHGAAVAGPRALRDLAGQRGDGGRRAGRAGGAPPVPTAASRVSAATAAPSRCN